jgi:hypothetical protein
MDSISEIDEHFENRRFGRFNLPLFDLIYYGRASINICRGDSPSTTLRKDYHGQIIA